MREGKINYKMAKTQKRAQHLSPVRKSIVGKARKGAQGSQYKKTKSALFIAVLPANNL